MEVGAAIACKSAASADPRPFAPVWKRADGTMKPWLELTLKYRNLVFRTQLVPEVKGISVVQKVHERGLLCELWCAMSPG